MKHIILKTAVTGLLLMGMVSCADDLNISSIDPKTSPSFNEMELLAKQYGTLGLTGQIGGSGAQDFGDDEGESGFYRVVFNLQELCADEIAWAWQDNEDMKPLTNIAWTQSSARAYWAYQRLSYDVTLYNSYLSEIGDRTDGEYPHYIAEVRFLRALHFYHFLDLFHKAPFQVDFNFDLPIEKAGVDLYNWIDAELTEIEGQLAPMGSFNSMDNFGRADQGAAYMLHARLALNSEVYTDGQVKDYQKAINYCNLLIGGPYELSKATNAKGFTGYEQVFMGDNDENEQARKEIIFPIRQDGNHIQEHAGSTYLVSSPRIAGMPYSFTDNYWSCNFARRTLVEKFFANVNDCPLAKAEDIVAYLEKMGWESFPLDEAKVIAADEELGGTTASIKVAANDDRALFYAGVGGCTAKKTRTYDIDGNIKDFLNGLSIVKWQNRRSDDDASKMSGTIYADTDIPLFRLAEAYLTRAEAKLRLGQDGALADVNELRSRAHTSQLGGIELSQMPDEWCREFYFEGRRRTDLVRFGLFTSSRYVWPMKGGTAKGTGVDSHFNVYPIPYNDIVGNPNMTQNPGY